MRGALLSGVQTCALPVCDFLEGRSREGFRIAQDISAYSFPARAKAALPLLKGRNSSVLTLTYLGAEKAIPNYNTMGLAKASLEASVRYKIGRASCRERVCQYV